MSKIDFAIIAAVAVIAGLGTFGYKAAIYFAAELKVKEKALL